MAAQQQPSQNSAERGEQQHNRIPTPWRVQWVRFRHQFLPVVTVILSAALAAWMWRRQAGVGGVLGEVETRRVAVTSEIDGTLAPLPGRQVEEFDRVGAGDVVAVLDQGPLTRRRATAQAEHDRLRGELGALDTGRPGAAKGGEGLRAAVSAMEEDLAQLDLRLDALEIRTPIAGTVTRVYLRPGQLVQAGQPILNVAAEEGAYIISYVRQGQTTPMSPGMPVEVRVLSQPRRTLRGQIDTVGAQIESVPAHQLRDPRIQEWGLPVRVVTPPGANLRPGELVGLSFKPPT